MRNVTRTEKLVKKNSTRARNVHKPGIKVRPDVRLRTVEAPGTRIHAVMGNRGRNVKYNEDTIDVTHLTHEQQMDLLMFLRTGHDMAGKPRFIDGVKPDPKKGMVPDSYRPSKDLSLALS